MALQMPSFISGGSPLPQQVNNANPTGVFDPQTGLVLPPQLLGRRLDAAQQMLQEGSSGAPIGSWTQGMNRVLQGLVGGYEEKKYTDQYMQGMQQGAQAGGNFLQSLMGGGSTGTGAPAPASGTTPSTTGAGSGATIGGNDAAKQAFDYFSQKYGPVAASGIVGNWMQESSFSPAVISGQRVGDPSIPAGPGYEGGSHYIGQWNRERLANLNNFASTKGMDPSDLNTQMQFADWELNNGYGSIKQKLLSAQTPGDAAAAFLGYEAPQGYKPGGDPAAVNGWGNRLSYANDAFQRFGGNSVAGNTAPSAPPPPNSGTPQNPGTSPTYPTVQQNMAQADATAGQPLPTSIPGPVQVASLDPSAGVPQAAAQQQQAPNTNIPLPPIDPRTADPGSFNKGLGATPGQQAVLAAASPGSAPPVGGPQAPALTPGAQNVANAVPAAGGAPSPSAPLPPGAQQVAQAASPIMAPQQGGIPPQAMQQYMQMMQNPYVPEAEKNMAQQLLMSRIAPHKMITVPTTGGTMLMDEITGQQRGFIPSPNYQKVTDINGVEHVYNMNDPSQAGLASGTGANGGGAGQAQLQPGQKTVREMFPGVPRPGAEEAFYTNQYNQSIAKGMSDQDARAAADDFLSNYRKQGQQTVTFTQENAAGKKVGEAVGGNMADYIDAAKDARTKLQALGAIKGVLNQYGGNISTGPGADAMLSIKQSLANAFPGTFGADAGPTEMLQKLSTQLATADAKSLASRPTQFDFATYLKNNPGIQMSIAGQKALVDLKIQQAQHDYELGNMATHEQYAKNPYGWADVVEQYDKTHPLMNPLTNLPADPNATDFPAPGKTGAPSSGAPAAPAAPPSAGGNFPVPPNAAIEYLRGDPSSASYFDQKYGPGASKKALGQ